MLTRALIDTCLLISLVTDTRWTLDVVDTVLIGLLWPTMVSGGHYSLQACGDASKHNGKAPTVTELILNTTSCCSVSIKTRLSCKATGLTGSSCTWHARTNLFTLLTRSDSGPGATRWLHQGHRIEYIEVPYCLFMPSHMHGHYAALATLWCKCASLALQAYVASEPIADHLLSVCKLIYAKSKLLLEREWVPDEHL